MKIFLVGLPGSGKTTLGKPLASHLGLPFVDLDHEIITHENKTVPEIFSSSGEDHFREVESKLLRKWSTSDQSFVMATGGGAPCFHDGIGIMNSAGRTIFLDVSVDELAHRLKSNKERPLLTQGGLEELIQKLKGLQEKRRDVYRQAQIIVADPDIKKLIKAASL